MERLDLPPEGTRPGRHLQLFEVYTAGHPGSTLLVGVILRFTSSQGDSNVAGFGVQMTCKGAESDAEECPAAAMLVTEVEIVGYFSLDNLSKAGSNLKRNQQLFNMNAHD